MKTRESEEMYLETILVMKNKCGKVRSVDIVGELNYAKSSVSRAVNLLKKRGFVTIGAGGEITLTATGRDKAEYVYRRHAVLTKALIEIGLDEKEAEDNACRMEHLISADAFRAIENHLITHNVGLD